MKQQWQRYVGVALMLAVLAVGTALPNPALADPPANINHADAHIGLGAYHAEVINKIGSLVGGLTYGASTDSGVKHFESALKLNPHSVIARIEYANGLVMMFGKSRMAQATRLYADAAKCVAADAAERLDIELARSEIKE